jgi:hypothetical protein
VTSYVDFTGGVRADLVGLDATVAEALVDTLAAWLKQGPPRENRRMLLGVDVYEAVVAERYLLAYTVDADRERFVLLWLRHRPGVRPT